MPIGICLQFSIRRHARRIGASRKCERIGRGFAKRLAGSGRPKFERWRSQRAANLQPRSEIGAKPETVRCLRGLLLTAESGRCEEGILRPSLPPRQTLRFGLRMGFTPPQRLFPFCQIWPLGVAEMQITNRREDRSHRKPGHLCESTLTSSGLTRSGTVQPWMSYSAMHWSANAFHCAAWPEALAPRIAKRRISS